MLQFLILFYHVYIQLWIRCLILSEQRYLSKICYFYGSDVLTSCQHDLGTIPIKSIDASLSSKGDIQETLPELSLKID